MTDIAAGSRTEEEAAVTGDATIRPFRIGFPEATYRIAEANKRDQVAGRETVTDSWRDRPESDPGAIARK